MMKFAHHLYNLSSRPNKASYFPTMLYKFNARHWYSQLIRSANDTPVCQFRLSDRATPPILACYGVRAVLQYEETCCRSKRHDIRRLMLHIPLCVLGITAKTSNANKLQVRRWDHPTRLDRTETPSLGLSHLIDSHDVADRSPIENLAFSLLSPPSVDFPSS
ncbi:hypothetical protein BD289DRAFT_64544 [Coniella lustricola]|uniref:Uncharacterized protein n=1 Tax=Coniella lustricola TaxID=2025994 RepID=A0A2T3AHV6_9PEZI|nr:hypothetical protein BD289DRAFT_64544 [Coniella lustricola]